ncbi:DUF4468 domain-containing protein [Spirochaetota bacterium]
MKIVMVLLVTLTIGCGTMWINMTDNQSYKHGRRGLARDVIFQRALSCMAIYFDNTKGGIRYQNEKHNRIVMRGTTNIIPECGGHRFTYTMVADVRNNGVRLRYPNVHGLYTEDSQSTDSTYCKESVKDYLKELSKTILNCTFEKDKWRELK